MHLEAAHEVIARQQFRASRNRCAVGQRALRRAEEELGAGIDRHRYAMTQFVLDRDDIGAGIDMQYMSLWAQPYIGKGIRSGALVDARGNQRAVRLEAGRDTHLRAQQRGQVRKAHDRRSGVCINVVQHHAIGRIGENLQCLAGHDGRLGISRRFHRQFLADGDRRVVRRDRRNIAVHMAQNEQCDVPDRMVPDRTIEIYRPDCRAHQRGRRMCDDEGRMREIELDIELAGHARRDLQRRDKHDRHGHRQIRRRSLRMLDLDFRGRDRCARRRVESCFRIGGRRQRHIAGIRAERHYGAGIGDGCVRDYGRVAKHVGQIVEIHEVRNRHGTWRRVNDHIGSAALRHQCDRQDLDADHGPILTRGVAHEHRHIAALLCRRR